MSINYLTRFEILKRITKSYFGGFLNLLSFVDHISVNRTSCVLDFKLRPFETFQKDLVIYGTYNKNGILRSEEITLIKELAKQNYLVVVQNGSVIDPLLPKLNCSYILRSNTGRDFGMLRDALTLLDISSMAMNLVWLNSSSNWNVNHLKKMINDEKTHGSAAVVSMTDSWRGGYHLQSFFYFVHSNYFNTFINFFRSGNVRNWRYKRTVVFYGEKKLSRYLEKSGLKLGSFYPAKVFSPTQYKHITTYLDFKNQLSKIGAPFSKIQF